MHLPKTHSVVCNECETHRGLERVSQQTEKSMLKRVDSRQVHGKRREQARAS